MNKHKAEEKVCSSIYVVVLFFSFIKLLLPDKWRDKKERNRVLKNIKDFTSLKKKKMQN